MMRRGFILLLISGHLLVCDLQPHGFTRHFRYVGLLRNWTEAQSYCREKFTDLATIQNSANNTEAQQATGSSQFWIGLHRGPWKWTGFTSTSFSSWGTDEPKGGDCAVINKAGQWFSRDCTDKYPFICISYFGVYVLTRYERTWKDAQSYCWNWQRNLATITSQTDNDKVSQAMQSWSSPEFAWIGLSRMSVWSDDSSASYRQWNAVQPHEEANCVMMNSSLVTWFWKPCDEKHFFLCYVDVPLPKSMMRLVKIRLSAGSADLMDPTVQDSILQQLKQRMVDRGIEEEVKLRWKTQPDGRIFHREDERAPPAVCEEDDACV